MVVGKVRDNLGCGGQNWQTHTEIRRSVEVSRGQSRCGRVIRARGSRRDTGLARDTGMGGHTGSVISFVS